MKSPRRLRQSADEKGAAAGPAAGAGGKGRTLYTYVFNLETLLLDCVETGESFELARRPAFLPLVTRDADLWWLVTSGIDSDRFIDTLTALL